MRLPRGWEAEKSDEYTISCVSMNENALVAGVSADNNDSAKRMPLRKRRVPTSPRPARALRRRRHWKRGHRLDLLHRKARRDILERDRADQLLVEHVIAL